MFIFLSDTTVLKGLGALTWVITEWREWSLAQALIFSLVVLVGLEVLAFLVNLMRFSTSARIPMRGKHLDALAAKDWCFISISKLSTVVFTHHLLLFCGRPDSGVVWDPLQLTLGNSLLALPSLYIVYDFFYTAWHRFLHLRFIYPYIHKHHHQQHAPSRGNLDAINVHPIEFITGEYDHLFSLFLVTRYLTQVHILTVLVFIVLGGFLASLNHTRFDVVSPLIPQIYQVRYHDIHHYDPIWNYGQYIMLWDALTGTFRPEKNDTSIQSSPSKSKEN